MKKLLSAIAVIAMLAQPVAIAAKDKEPVKIVPEEKGGKTVPRQNSCRIFGAKLYELMGWIPDHRYKVQAVYQKIENAELLVFNLEECEMIVPQFSEGADGKRVRKVKRYYPDSWKDSFGMT